MRFIKRFLLSVFLVIYFSCSAFGANWYVGSTKWSAVSIWVALTSYSVGDLRRQTAALGTLTVGNERVFRCTTAGVSGAAEPTWVLTKGATTTDATAVWTEVTGVDTYGWGAPHARLANAFAWGAAGDVFWVNGNASTPHAETQAAAMTLTSPGTAASPCQVLCVNDASTPPTALAETSAISTTGTYAIVFNTGFTYVYGITFTGTSSSATTIITFVASSAPWGWTFENCKLVCGNTSTSGVISIGISGSVRDQKLVLNNTKIQFANASQSISIGSATIFWVNTPAALAGATFPTVLFRPTTTGIGAIVTCSGVDLSALGSGKSLVTASNNNGAIFNFNNCQLGSNVAAISGAITSPGGTRTYIDACDSSDPSNGPRSEAYTYQGSVTTNTGIYRTGGASDGTAYSLKMATNATGVSFISPLVNRPIFKVSGTTGSAITATVHIIQADGSTALKESECWAEVEYMGTSGSTLTSFLNDNASTVLTLSTTDQATSTETWTGLTGTPVKQKLEVTFTPAEKGYYMIRVYLAKPSATVYVCPKIVVS